MKTFIIDKRDEGRRLDRWIARELPALGMGLMQKYLRTKRFKIDGKPAKGDTRLCAGQTLSVYLGDECFEKPARRDSFLEGFTPALRIVYEDEHLLLVDKKPGLLVHGDKGNQRETLLNHIRAYLYQKGAFDSLDPNAFAPALCNRIDRFTGGIVLAAKDQETLKAMNACIKTRQVDKYYLCIVHGSPKAENGCLASYLFKPDTAKKQQVSDIPVPGGKLAQTQVRVLAQRDGLSLVLCRLLTGYTHQIRAQFAHIGCPLLGDSQYGSREKDARWGWGYQALCAVAVRFDFQTPPQALLAYHGRCFTVSDVPFVKRYFPQTDWRSALPR